MGDVMGEVYISPDFYTNVKARDVYFNWTKYKLHWATY